MRFQPFDAVHEGSSPRGRGKRWVVGESARRAGLIPAWAGKTREGGSGCPNLVRLIPAWAGKTTRWRLRTRNHRAHPRVGGENSSDRRARSCATGSSPRGRGKRWVVGESARRAGLIPAWAGKTGARMKAHARQQAHPRVGGENSWPEAAPRLSAGSSPRGRGKPSRSSPLPYRRRLIPAWAGKTQRICDALGLAPAHPRVGGENADERNHRLRLSWLIPAWAGKTLRGESSMTTTDGSSPRGRGKPRHDHQR